jgi:hypothetical protein
MALQREGFWIQRMIAGTTDPVTSSAEGSIP